MPKTKPTTPAQSFAKAVSINDINYIMLKRRDSGGHMSPMSLKRVFCVFALLDKFLGGDGLAAEKSDFWKPDDTNNEKLQREYDAQVTPNEILDEIITSTVPMRDDRREKWNIIVFSETFFSDEPWDSTEIEKFLKLCRLLTIKYPKTVISVNFLHKYHGKSSAFSRNTPKGKNYVVSQKKSELQQNKSSDLRFSNSSLIFWSGVSLSCYRKTSYKMEVESEDKDEDNILKHGYGYDFGDFKSYAPPELSAALDDHKKFAKLFNSGRGQIIAARTCYDMNLTPKLSKQIKLLILTADGSPDATSWQDKLKNARACVSDADRGGFMVISGIRQNTPKIHSLFFIQKELLYTMFAYHGEIEDEKVDYCC